MQGLLILNFTSCVLLFFHGSHSASFSEVFGFEKKKQDKNLVWWEIRFFWIICCPESIWVKDRKPLASCESLSCLVLQIDILWKLTSNLLIALAFYSRGDSLFCGNTLHAGTQWGATWDHTVHVQPSSETFRPGSWHHRKDGAHRTQPPSWLL